MKITFDSLNETGKTIIITIPKNITIKESNDDNQLYFVFYEPNDTNLDKETLRINLNTFRNESFNISSDGYFLLNIANNDRFYIRKFSFRYTYSSQSSFFGNLFTEFRDKKCIFAESNHNYFEI